MLLLNQFARRALVAALVLGVGTLWAQQNPTLATVASTVVDPDGAAIAGAGIVLQDSDPTGQHLEMATDAAGSFRLALVEGHSYTVHVQVVGFAPYLATVRGGEPLPVVRLQLARISEAITVDSTGSATIDPEETQTGLTLSEKQLTNVPLNGRSFTDLLAITTGVVPVSSAQPNAVVMSGVASTPPSGSLDLGALSVSGQRETANAFRVNGSNVQEDVNMGIAIVPTLDSIAELSVLTDSFDAKLGNQSGGQIQVTTHSGTEHLHGSAYNYFRNTSLDARSYFSQVRAGFHQNQYGGTLGGPAGWKHAFYFADYQGTRQTQGIDTGLIPVPSLADRAGDLTDSMASLTGTVSGAYWAHQLSTRLRTAVTAGEPYAQVFPSGQIPVGAWSAPARALLQYIPLPNQTGNTFSTSSYAQATEDNKGALRLDVTTRAGALGLYGFVDDYSLVNPYPTAQGGATVPGFNARNDGRAQLYAANLTTALGSAGVNQAHLSYMRNAAVVDQPVDGLGTSLESQGFVTGANTNGIVPLLPDIEGVENIVFNSFTMGTGVTGLYQAENIAEATDDLTRTLGAHTLAFGASFHADQINTHPDVYDNGSFSFTGSETGLDFADFLLGVDTSYTQGQGRNFYNRNHYIGLYAQDSWRATPSLTLNYGLRWDVLPPWYEKYNQLLTLDPAEQSVVFPNAPQGILFPGDPGVPRTLSATRYTNFDPRMALAWSPGGRGSMVLRAGYGMYSSAFEGLSAGIMSGNPPYGFTDTSAAPTLFDQPFVTAATGVSVGQRFPLQDVPFGATAAHPVSSVNWADFEPLTGIPAFAKNNVPPYAENYTVSVERQLDAYTSLSVSYVGTQAHHLLVIQEVNPGDPALCLALSKPANVAAGSATCGPFNESSTFASAAAPTVTIQGTRTAYSSAFGSVNLQRTIANAHDNALEVNLRRTSRTVYVQLAYTWSRSIDQSSSLAEAVYPESAGGPGMSRAVSAFDMTHNVTATYRYELPLGQWLHSDSRMAAGWQVSGLTRIGTGLPVTLVNNNDTSLLGTAPNGINNNGVDEPEFTPGNLEINHRPGGTAFNTELFALPALGTLGNARRRFFYGPGEVNTDLALAKKTQMGEGVAMELRVEAFNVFNHGQFFGADAVDGNISSANFGQIQTASPPRLMQLAARVTF